MKRNLPLGSPGIAQNPAHAAVVASLQKLRQSEIEAFLYRLTRSHTTALFLREVTYWFMPSKRDPARPRATFYRDGFYWFGRTQRTWLEQHELSRDHLETAYRRCAEFLTVNHYMFMGFRTTFYRLDFEKLRNFIDGDQKLQAQLQKSSVRALPPNPSRLSVRIREAIEKIDWVDYV